MEIKCDECGNIIVINEKTGYTLTKMNNGNEDEQRDKG